MTPFMIYLWLSLDSINKLFVILAILLIIVGLIIIVLVICFEDDIEYSGIKLSKCLKLVLGLFLGVVTLCTFIPTTKQAAIIFGVPYLINNAKEIHADQLPVKVVDYLNTYLDKEIKEMKK